MIFGDSGNIACSALRNRRPGLEAIAQRLVLAQLVAVATVVSTAMTRRLRGPQFDAAWVERVGEMEEGRRDVEPAAVCVTPRR